MRLLLVRPGPEFSVQDVANGWSKALTNLGVTVGDYNLNDRLTFYAEAKVERGGEHVKAFDDMEAVLLAAKGLEAACYEFWPDVVLIVSGFFIPPQMLDLFRSRNHKVVLLHTESPYEDERQLARAEHADLNVVNDPTNLWRFQKLSPAYYVPHAYDPENHCPGPSVSELECDFCFVGTGYPSRVVFFERVDWTGLDVILGGNWQVLREESPLWESLGHERDACLDNSETVKTYRSAKSSANFYRREAESADLSAGWSMGPREVELAATGCFYMTEERGENREVLPMVPTFDGPEDFSEQLRWFLAHDKERCSIVERAREAIAPRTFEANARTLLRQLERL